MTAKEFLRAVANGRTDVIAALLGSLKRARTPYCVIGGLAVNAYTEPVVSLDLDIVVIARDLDRICRQAEKKGFRVERFAHSIVLTSPQSDVRVQLQTDERYQAFIPRASARDVLGYRMRVADAEDVLQGKVWAYQDESRRASKRHKDLADIARLVEARPPLLARLPAAVRERMLSPSE